MFYFNNITDIQREILGYATLVLFLIIGINLTYDKYRSFFHPLPKMLHKVAAVFSLMLGIAILYFSAISTFYTIDAQQWEQKKCSIQNIHYRYAGKGSTDIDIDYTYTIDGIRYIGHRVYYTGNGIDRNDIPLFKVRYRIGNEIICYIDFKEPSRSVLFNTIQGNLTNLSGMYIFTLLSFYAFFLSLKEIIRK